MCEVFSTTVLFSVVFYVSPPTVISTGSAFISTALAKKIGIGILAVLILATAITVPIVLIRSNGSAPESMTFIPIIDEPETTTAHSIISYSTTAEEFTTQAEYLPSTTGFSDVTTLTEEFTTKESFIADTTQEFDTTTATAFSEETTDFNHAETTEFTTAETTITNEFSTTSWRDTTTVYTRV